MHFYFHLHFTGATTLINQAITTFPQKDKLLGEQEQNKTYRVCQKFRPTFTRYNFDKGRPIFIIFSLLNS